MLEPLPGVAGAVERDGLESLITLTTCHPQFSNAERMIIHGMLTGVETKPGAPQPAAAEGGLGRGGRARTGGARRAGTRRGRRDRTRGR